VSNASGRVSTGVLAGLAACLAAAAFAIGLFGIGPRGRPSPERAEVVDASGEGPPEEVHAPEEPRFREAILRPERTSLADLEAGEERDDPAPTSGSLRVVVVRADGERLVDECVVTIGPPGFRVGEGEAATREARIPSGSDRCAFDSLPFGLYGVSVVAEGRPRSSGFSHVFLQAEAPHPLVRVVLHAAEVVDGTILDEDGAPVEGVRVSLIPEEEGGGRVRAEARSNSAGDYRIEGVVDGFYSLRVGPEESPYVAPLRIQMAGSSLRHDVRLPRLGSLEVLVTDEAGRPLEDARVEGYGPEGGTFHGRTDPTGTFLARALPGGEYRLHVRYEGLGPLFTATVVRAGSRATTRAVLRPVPH
jgi:hypothetical protein